MLFYEPKMSGETFLKVTFDKNRFECKNCASLFNFFWRLIESEYDPKNITYYDNAVIWMQIQLIFCGVLPPIIHSFYDKCLNFFQGVQSIIES